MTDPKFKLSANQQAMLKGFICPYCFKRSELVNSKVVYGEDLGMMYRCAPCDAYVGCHKGTTTAKGRLANKTLRELKKQVHTYFDLIWKTGTMERSAAYAWLSEKLQLPAQFTHIGMFGEKSCTDAIYFSKQFLNDQRRLDLDMGAKPVTTYFPI